VSAVYAVCGFAAFAVSAVSGPLADRVGPRPLAVAGMALVAAGLLGAAAARTLAEVQLSYGLVVGLGIGLAYVPAIAAVQRWFVVWRGLASGIAAAGIGLGTALVPPAAWACAALGDWRTAFAIACVLVAVVGIGGAMLLATSPERYGEWCDGDAGAPATPVGRVGGEGPSAAAALRSRGFWTHYAGTLLISVPVSLPLAHLAQSAAAAGLGQADALALVGLLGVGSVVGRFAFGAVADGIGRDAAFLGCCGAVAALTLLWAAAEGRLLFAVFAVAFGAVYGGFVALLPAVTTDRFGRRGAGGVIGVLYTARGIGLLLAAPLLPVLVEDGSGYSAPLCVAAAIGVSGTALLALVPRELRDASSNACLDDTAILARASGRARKVTRVLRPECRAETELPVPAVADSVPRSVPTEKMTAHGTGR
jgi:MFS transporter, OFA family, oxalate/formate antiporter